MAILRGFPPSNTISPTTYISKKDLADISSPCGSPVKVVSETRVPVSESRDYNSLNSKNWHEQRFGWMTKKRRKQIGEKWKVLREELNGWLLENLVNEEVSLEKADQFHEAFTGHKTHIHFRDSGSVEFHLDDVSTVLYYNEHKSRQFPK